MNKLMTAAIVTGGLMFLNSPEAAAHTEVRYSYQPSPYYHYYSHVDERRSKHMPRWLQRNDSFRRWYKHTSLRKNRRLAWGELFDIYRWEYRRGYSYRGRAYYSDRKDRRHGKGRREQRRHRH